MAKLTHFDDAGASRMVDVGSKEPTEREACAEGFVIMNPTTLELIQNEGISKGNVLEVARLAGIMGAKQTSALIPLCHPLSLDGLEISFEVLQPDRIRIESKVCIHARTGVEMEALTAVTVAALTIYDMCKSVDRSMTLGPFELLEKKGGKSGHYLRVEKKE